MTDIIRIIPPLSALDKRIGDLKLNDMVLTDVIQNETISAISSYLFSDATKINQINEKVNSLSDYTKLSTFKLSVETLSSWIGACNQLIEDLSGKAIFYYLNNVSLLKAPADEPTNLCMWFYTSPEMSTGLSVSPITGEENPLCSIPVVFDSANEYDRQFIEALLINNVENGEDSSIEEGRKFSHGTQWMVPVSSDGFGEEYNNAPVNLKLVNWALGHKDLSAWASKFNKNTKLYTKYIWYYVLNDIVHASDVYSQVLPTQTEQTTPRETGSTTTTEDLAVINNVAWNDSIKGFSFDAYDIEAGKVNFLINGLDSTDYDHIYLTDYSPAKEYKVKFIANSNFTIGLESVKISGNGVSIEDFDNYSELSFISGKTYLISIQAGMITVLAQKATKV